MMTAFLYKWTNKDNKEYYIGVHEGEESDDYIASSSSFLEKYNAKKTRWKRTILSHHNTMAEALKVEALTVTEETLKDPNCLNKMVGGEPTFSALELKMATLSALYHRFNLGIKIVKNLLRSYGVITLVNIGIPNHGLNPRYMRQLVHQQEQQQNEL